MTTNDYAKKIIITGIKAREPLEAPFVALSQIIAAANLPSGYVTMAGDRLCDAGLVGFEDDDVWMDFLNLGDMLFTGDALEKARTILMNYVSKIVFNESLMQIRTKEKMYNLVNSRTEMLRNMSAEELRKACELDSEHEVFYREELKQRSLTRKAERSLKSAIEPLYTEIKYRDVFSMVDRVAKSVKEEVDSQTTGN